MISGFERGLATAPAVAAIRSNARYPSPPAPTIEVEATVNAQLATGEGNPGVAGEVQRRRKRRRNAEAADKKNATSSAASGSELMTSETEHSETIDDNTFPISYFLEKDARDEMRLEWARSPGEAAEVVAAASASTVRSETAEVVADASASTATSSAASGSELLTSETEHNVAIDDNRFPISCFLEKDARGVYTLSGFCRLCDRTFRAVGTVWKGRVMPWYNHARVQHQIVQHARTHGAIGYTPHRNLDELRLDWTWSPDDDAEVVAAASVSTFRNETAEVVADASTSTVRRIKKIARIVEYTRPYRPFGALKAKSV